ncbi:SRPBCC domain-containing protein [Microbacterium bovistercoris]|uniref:SRPBCC domain-containing protein n=1 Tax=Microbacterium bovistercoris TaxID=2293570 RepID=A0A371NUA9_9MICO|nr:SRPBCC domain-containing protein [Microbacterium bovistercoris]REJ05969.1 SRPBCC domain-containing protein [Microbacterium bovistercoris]
MNETSTTEAIGLKVQVEIEATPEAVFDAYTDPAAQRIWLSALGPDEGAVQSTVDLRVGGVWEARFHPNPQTRVHDRQTYREIDRPHRLVTDLVAESFVGEQQLPTVESRIVVTFEPAGQGTLVTVEQSPIATAELRDFFRDVAWPGGLARLGAHLHRQAS